MVVRTKSKAGRTKKADPEDDPINPMDVTSGENFDDEIVREIDVFLSPEMSEQINLLQYPLVQQPLGVPEAARIKPRHCQIELDHSIPADMTPNGRFQMPTRSYKSNTIPITTHLALGKIIETSSKEGLHLVPLSRISQMRPSFSHVDEVSDGQSHSSPTNSEDEAIRQKAEEAKFARKPLAFQKKETERAALARKSSFAYKKASIESESWQQLSIYEEESPQHDIVSKQIPCPAKDQKHPILNQKLSTEGKTGHNNHASAYVQSLNYLPSAKSESTEISGGTDPASLVTKLTNLLHEGKPTPFSLLRNHFPISVNDHALFEALEACAVLVRGNFVLQSRLLPLQPAVAQARTFILFLMQLFENVHRNRLELVYQDDDTVNAEAILLILQQVATRTEHGWKSKVDDGIAFVERNPEVASAHMEFWSTQARRFGPMVELYQSVCEE